MQKERRRELHVRLSDGGFEALDKIAHDERVTRSDVLRICLAVAMKHRSEVVAMIRDLKEVG